MGQVLNSLSQKVSAREKALIFIQNVLSKKEFKFLDLRFPDESLKGIGKTFSILSYNVLADCYSSGMEKDVPQELLDFEYRSVIIGEEFRKLNADIILLQELDHFEDFYKIELEKQGYGLVLAQRPERPDYAIVGYKKEIFDLVSEDFISFDKDHRYEKNLDFVRKNVAAVAVLKHKESQKNINVIGTHFFWNPRQEHVKYFQMELMLKYIASKFKNDDMVIWGGDLNTKPGDNLIHYMKNRAPPEAGNIEFYSDVILKYQKEMFEEVEKISNKFEWGNSYENYGLTVGDKNNGLPKWTNYTRNFKSTLDHIFYSKKTVVPRKVLKIPDEDEIKSIALPNEEHPSDHLPIMTVFEIL